VCNRYIIALTRRKAYHPTCKRIRCCVQASVFFVRKSRMNYLIHTVCSQIFQAHRAHSYRRPDIKIMHLAANIKAHHSIRAPAFLRLEVLGVLHARFQRFGKNITQHGKIMHTRRWSCVHRLVTIRQMYKLFGRGCWRKRPQILCLWSLLWDIRDRAVSTFRVSGTTLWITHILAKIGRGLEEGGKYGRTDDL
jgi:hypothetical protein